MVSVGTQDRWTKRYVRHDKEEMPSTSESMRSNSNPSNLVRSVDVPKCSDSKRGNPANLAPNFTSTLPPDLVSGIDDHWRGHSGPSPALLASSPTSSAQSTVPFLLAIT